MHRCLFCMISSSHLMLKQMLQELQQVLSFPKRVTPAFSAKNVPTNPISVNIQQRVMYAITEPVKKQRQYLIGTRFHIYTYQRSLRHLLTQSTQITKQQKWATKLIGLEFEILYKPGVANKVADALCRNHPRDESVILSISSSVPEILEQLSQFYQTNQGKELYKNLSHEKHFTKKQDLL